MKMNAAITNSRVRVIDELSLHVGKLGTVTDSTDINSVVFLDNTPISIIFSNDQLEYVPSQPEKPDHDSVNHPSHYTFGKYEVKDVLMDWFSDKPLLWQVGKYIARAFHKGNPLEDLKKAQFYLNEQIQILEKK